MAAWKIRLLQLGDVHYPDAIKDRPLVDLKDKGFSPTLTETLAATPFANVVRKLNHILQNEDVHALALMGDLTSRGNHVGYEDCVAYLKSALIDSAWHPRNVHHVLVVPGNHDINRKDYKDGDLDNKFAPLLATLAKHALQPLPVSTFIKIDITCPVTGGAALFGINSCVGCGEKRHLPEVLREEIFSAISAKIAGTSVDGDAYKAILDQVCEQLDTPLITQDCITDIVNATLPLDPSWIPIIAAHHNLVPQVTPRIDVYTELVNSGQFRKALLELDRPIVYLHGHVHTDPIEVLHDPRFPSSQIIAVSAPQLAEGYNIIEIHYSPAGVPYGCLVTQHRHRETSQVVSISETRIPFLSTQQGNIPLSQVASVAMKHFSDQGIMYYNDLKRACGRASKGITDDELLDAIEELTWRRYVKIDNPRMTHTQWRISRNI